MHVTQWKDNGPCETNNNLENISQHISKFPPMKTGKVQNKVQNTCEERTKSEIKELKLGRANYHKLEQLLFVQ